MGCAARSTASSVPLLCRINCVGYKYFYYAHSHAVDPLTAAECMSLLIGHFYTPRSKSWTDMKCPRHTGCVLERCGPYLCRFAKLLYIQLVCTALSHFSSCDRTVNCTRSITLLLITCVVLQLLLWLLLMLLTHVLLCVCT